MATTARRHWKRMRRKIRWCVLSGMVLIVALIGAFPWVLGLRPVKDRLIAQANQRLAPAHLEAGGIAVSWFQPAVLTDCTLYDQNGNVLIHSDEIRWDRTLGQFLWDRPRLGVLDLGAATVRIARNAAGDVNIADALAPLFTGNPFLELEVRCAGGPVRFEDDHLPIPLIAEDSRISISIQQAPEPIRWDAEFRSDPPKSNAGRPLASSLTGLTDWERRAQQSGLPLISASALIPPQDADADEDEDENENQAPGVLTIRGRYERQTAGADGDAGADDAQHPLAFMVRWDNWPWSVRNPSDNPNGVTREIVKTSVGGRLNGLIQQDDEQLKADFLTTLKNLDVTGFLPSLDKGGIGNLSGHVKYNWKTGRLEITGWESVTPLGTLRVEGGVKTPLLGDTNPDARDFTLTGSFTPRWDVCSLFLQDALDRVNPNPEIRISLFGQEQGQGKRVVTIAHKTGKTAAASTPARITGRDVTFTARGDWKSLAQGNTVELSWLLPDFSVQARGLNLGPITIKGVWERGQLTMEPIAGAFNGGKIVLLPELQSRTDPSAPKSPPEFVLRLRPGSRLDNVTLNDEMTGGFLAFVAPVLAQATRVHGRISADILRAEWPVNRREANRNANTNSRPQLAGRVTFHDVTFSPGPLAHDLLRLIGGDRFPINATMRIRDPIRFVIHESGVSTEGLVLPLGDVTEIRLEGRVLFDRSLDLRVTLPITPAMVLNHPILGDIVRGTHIVVPIRGTLSQPRMDQEAFQNELGKLGETLARKGILRGSFQLLEMLSKTKNAQNPRTTEEKP